MYKYIIPIFARNSLLFFAGIIVVQILLLFIFIKPPVELRKSSVATSLLVRELLLLRAHVLGLYGIKDRRQTGRYIYFSKKYFAFIAKDMIHSRFDTASQKSYLRDYFNSINNYLDNLNTQIKLGTKQNLENVVAQIEHLVFAVAVESFGEISNAIPEVQKRLEIKFTQPKPPSLVKQTFQFFDTSVTARSILVILVLIIINLLNPSLWEYIQNMSSLFQLMTP